MWITRREHRAAFRNGSYGSFLAKYPADRILTSSRSDRYSTGYARGREADKAAPCHAFWLRLGPLLQLLHLVLCVRPCGIPTVFSLRRPGGTLEERRNGGSSERLIDSRNYRIEEMSPARIHFVSAQPIPAINPVRLRKKYPNVGYIRDNCLLTANPANDSFHRSFGEA